jgi:Flp pilus assembly pilin Flp
MNGIEHSPPGGAARRKRFTGGFPGVTEHFTPSTSSTHNSPFSTPSFSSRNVLARRKARLIQRREVNQVFRLFNALRREEGQTMAEYGVVLAVITIAVFGALALLSGNIVSAINRVAAYIT